MITYNCNPLPELKNQANFIAGQTTVLSECWVFHSPGLHLGVGGTGVLMPPPLEDFCLIDLCMLRPLLISTFPSLFLLAKDSECNAAHCEGLKLQASISNSAATGRQLIGCLCTQRTVAGNGYVNTRQSGVGDCQIRPHVHYRWFQK